MESTEMLERILSEIRCLQGLVLSMMFGLLVLLLRKK